MGEETGEEDLSPSYSNKTPEVEWLYFFEKSEGGKRKWFDSVSCLPNHLAMGSFRGVQERQRSFFLHLKLEVSTYRLAICVHFNSCDHIDLSFTITLETTKE